MLRSLIFSLLAFTTSLSQAQQLVTYPSTNESGGGIEVQATLTLPKPSSSGAPKMPAVVLLHSKGGAELAVTGQYAKALGDAGFVVIEPVLFRTSQAAPSAPLSNLQQTYDALKYLSQRDDVDAKKIGVAGFSYGGALALHAAAAWSQEAFAKGPGLKFAAHASAYPVCWVLTAYANGKRKTPLLPEGAFTKWSGAPIRIFAGELDDYDDRDSNACNEFVSGLPSDIQKLFSIQLYPNATHGWDQKSTEFYERAACKGRGCTNRNVSNPQVTQQSISDVLAFFNSVLR